MSQAEGTVDLSIIIVNYNVKEFLANCLTSVKKASIGLSTEILVVDNASTDGSIPFLKERFSGCNLHREQEEFRVW